MRPRNAISSDFSFLDEIALMSNLFRSYLKNVFWPPAFFGGIGAAFQILDIQQYASGLKLGPAAILNQNPIFEMASRKILL
jgi:hypothetical protein